MQIERGIDQLIYTRYKCICKKQVPLVFKQSPRSLLSDNHYQLNILMLVLEIDLKNE